LQKLTGSGYTCTQAAESELLCVISGGCEALRSGGERLRLLGLWLRKRNDFGEEHQSTGKGEEGYDEKYSVKPPGERR
jgi:hypothetical protein